MTGGSWREELFLLSFLRVSRHQSACLYRFSMTLSEIALAAPRAPPSLPENRVSPRDARGSWIKPSLLYTTSAAFRKRRFAEDDSRNWNGTFGNYRSRDWSRAVLSPAWTNDGVEKCAPATHA